MKEYIMIQKMKGYVAVQRKLLLMIYTLWTKNEKYDRNQYLITA